MRFQGKIIRWDDAKGFGFVLPNSGDKEVFIHISAFSDFGRRPKINELVSYSLSKGKNGRIQASEAAYISNANSQILTSSKSSLNHVFIIFFALFLVFIFERAINGKLPRFFPIIFIGANLIAFLCYFNDKASAVKNKWRTKESTLHLLSLIGGWGGAYIAQRMFRHKYKKSTFMWTYWLCVLINSVVITILALPSLKAFLLEKLSF